MNMKKIMIIILGLALSACSKVPKSDGFTIVTSFFPYHSMTEYLVDESDDLINIMPLNMEVHDFEPSPKDIALLEEADLLIVHGGGLEDWLESVLKSINNPNIKVLELASFVDQASTDPHTWLDPSNGLIQFTAIKDQLISLNPSLKNHYSKQFEHYEAVFKELIVSYDVLNDYRGETIIVDHLAYSYLLNPYGIEQKSVFGSFNSNEASAQDIEAIIKLIKDEGIETIFETEFSESKINKLLIKETGVEILKLSTLEMSDKEETYLSLMKLNLESLLKGLK